MNYVLPGMGASKDMYTNDWLALDDYAFLNWPRGFRGDTIPLLAAHFIEEHSITSSDSIVGTSLGGMVACEIANQIATEKVVLISSALKPEEVSQFLESIHPLIDFTPIEFLKRLAKIVPSELAHLFVEADAALIRRMCRAVFNWEGHQSEAHVFRIHGRRDRVIPMPMQVDRVVDGGHMIAMTHASECVRATESFLKLL